MVETGTGCENEANLKGRVMNMNKKDFIARLNELLYDLPMEERVEAVSYYEEYFEDAGFEREQETLAELGSPERVAATIRENFVGSGEENGGVYTETGYHSSTVTPGRQELVTRADEAEKQTEKRTAETQRGAKTEKQADSESRNGGQKNRINKKALLAVLLVLFAVPIGGLLLGAVGVAIGILTAIFGVVIAVAAVAVTFLLVGAGLVVVGCAHLFSVPPASLVLCGIGFLFFGAGMLVLILTVFLCGQLIPMAVKGIISLCKRTYQKGKEKMA